jgi:hypothetical protein
VKRFVAAVAFVLMAVVVAAADFSGNWSVDGDVASHPVKFVCALKQAGDKLSGTTTLEGKEIAITGSVKEKTLTFTFDVDYQGSTYTNVYTGTLDDNGVVQGTIEVAGQLGTFTAKKQ